MPPEFKEPRPTVITVIGWAWTIIGGLMLGSSIMVLVASLVPGGPSLFPGPSADPELPMARIWAWFPALVAGQAVLGVTGIFFGRRFLALDARARPTLEVLSWILLVMVIGSPIMVLSNMFATIGDSENAAGFLVFGGVVTLFSMAMYAAPVGLMIYHLRSAKVRDALAPAHRADPTPSAPAD